MTRKRKLTRSASIRDHRHRASGCAPSGAPRWRCKDCGKDFSKLKRRNMTYADLVGMLKRIGVKEEEHNLRNKVARGKFTAAFFLQCLSAIGCQVVRLDGQ